MLREHSDAALSLQTTPKYSFYEYKPMKHKQVKYKGPGLSGVGFSNHAIALMYSRINREYRPQTDGVIGLAHEWYDDDLDEVTVEREEE